VLRRRAAVPAGLAVLLLATGPETGAWAGASAGSTTGSTVGSTAGSTVGHLAATTGEVRGTTTDADPPSAQRPRRAAAIEIATYNVASTLRTRRAVRDVKQLAASGVDIVALQEMANPARRARVRAALVTCARCHFRAHMPRRAVQGSTPILYRAHRFRLEGSGTRRVARATRVGAHGAGPARVRARYVNWVRVRDEVSGRALVILNNHAIPSVQGHKGAPDKKARGRLEVYRRHMHGLQRMVTRFKRAGAKVFVTGDLNVNYRTDRRVAARPFPYHRLGAVGMRASYEALGEPRAGTHVLRSGNDRRLIDYVYFLPRRSVRPVQQSILRGYASDHRPLVVGFRLVRRR
jgi:endonuclease/exonuclease/phosphatase family metal-dependent hydrolase